MARPQTKSDLINASEESYTKLMNLIQSMDHSLQIIPFDFSKEPERKEAHWRRDKNLKDVIIHLYEWHQLLLEWVDSNQKGIQRTFIPEPYNWKTYGEMNRTFVTKHKNTSLEESLELFEASHRRVMNLIEMFSNDELFSKDVFKWVGGSTLGSYCVSATSSHYEWALKKIKVHIKNQS